MRRQAKKRKHCKEKDLPNAKKRKWADIDLSIPNKPAPTRAVRQTSKVEQERKKRAKINRAYKNRGVNGPLAPEKPEIERIRDALSGLIDGTYLSIGDAAQSQRIHYEKVRRRASGKVPWYKRNGPDPCLTLFEERHLARWITVMGEQGFPVSPKLLIDTVENMVTADGRVTPFKNGRPSRSWYKGFLRRNPSLTLKPTRMMDKSRTKVTSDEADKWFQEFSCFMSDLDLCNKPELIYIFDESDFCMSSCYETMGSLPQIFEGQGKKQTTVGMCANALGQLLPPFLLFEGNVPTSWDPLAGAPPGSMAYSTETGRMTKLSFHHWFEELFLKSIGKDRPLVLLIDSCQHHISFDLFKLAEENNVHLYRLLPNATHFLQPVFRLTKQLWWEELRKRVKEHPEDPVSQKVVGHILGRIWKNVEMPSVIRKSFASAGVYPINRQAIDCDDIVPSETFEASPPREREPDTSEKQAVQTPVTLQLTSNIELERKKRAKINRAYKNRGVNGPLAPEKPEIERLRDALLGLVDGKYLSISDAAQSQNVHYEKVRRRASGIVPWYKRNGPDPCLTLFEERHLARWITVMEKQGFPVSPKLLKDTVENMVTADGRVTPFKNGRPSRSWYKGFLRRNPSITLKPTRMIDRRRTKVTSGDADKWFQEFSCFMSDMDLCNKPELIYIFAESDFCMSSCYETMGSLPQIFEGQGKKQTTVGMCANALGQLLPPFLLLQEDIPTEWDPLLGTPPGSIAYSTETGWMTKLSFYHWFEELFLKSIGKDRPVVLLIDSGQDHISFDLFKLAEENNVHLYRFLPNATHFLQPRDTGVFGFTKQLWWEELRKWVKEHPEDPVSQKVVGHILGRIWESVERPSLIRNSFASAGVYPINRQAIDCDDTVPSEAFEASPPREREPDTSEKQAVQTPVTPPKQKGVSSNSETILPSARPARDTRNQLMKKWPFDVGSLRKGTGEKSEECLCPICGKEYPINTILCWKSARQLLESENQLLDGKDCKKIGSIDRLRVCGELDLAVSCLLKSLQTDPYNGWNWSQLAEVFSKKGIKSKAKTCFKQAGKLNGQLTSSHISKWHVLAPFVSGKAELDGDPVEAYGGIHSVGRWRFNETEVFYSELAPGGTISWKVYQQVSNQPVQISPTIHWGDLVNSLGSLAISEWQGWAIGEFSVNSEREDVSVQCLGVPAVYIDDNLLAGDVYRRDYFCVDCGSDGCRKGQCFITSRNPYSLYQTKGKGYSTQTFALHKPSKVPDLVDGHLFSEEMPLAVGITNRQGTKWLTNVRFKLQDGDERFTIGHPQGMKVAPGQTALIPIYLTEKSILEVACNDVILNLRVITSSGSSDVSVSLRCRTKHESFIMTFEDHDGSIQEAAVIAPHKSCQYRDFSVILTLHGTGVPAQNQADSYKYMEDGEWVFGLDQAWVLAPTRHGAHNWEGPGSLTAMTALKKLHEYTHQVTRSSWFQNKKASKEEVIFAGHSMGGHGAWHLATHYPQLAKAVISLAGWNKKEEYGDSNKFFEFDVSSSHTEPALKTVLEMCFTENDVDKLVSNLKGIPVFARVGANDRTVHPFFIRRMYRLLKEEGVNVTYREVKDKEHWWWDTWKTNDGGVVNDPELRTFMNYYSEPTDAENSRSCPADGGDCDESSQDTVWFDRVTSTLKTYTFTIINPVYHGYVHGFKVVQQIIPLRRSTIQITFVDNGVKVSTRNILTLSIDLPQELFIQVDDGDKFSLADYHGPVSICQKLGLEPTWVICDTDDIGRTWISYGPARRVAEQPFLIVSGTQEESTRTRLLQLSTYLSNLFVLTSDTVVRIVEDISLKEEEVEGHNLILIGNETENRWTETFLKGIPIKTTISGFHLNGCRFSDEDVGVLSLAPSGDKHLALIVMASSVSALKTLIHLATPTIPPMTRSPFSNMIPDFIITGPNVRVRGPGGYHCAGFWGNHWEFRSELASCVC